MLELAYQNLAIHHGFAEVGADHFAIPSDAAEFEQDIDVEPAHARLSAAGGLGANAHQLKLRGRRKNFLHDVIAHWLSRVEQFAAQICLWAPAESHIGVSARGQKRLKLLKCIG